ncbi:winged helix-turn-helix transcriptional regulator [Thermophilibacter provencensis]|uniref:winged helix-turn-helix transcriptional regulator n=1 Tax=Thermophilibacter provencensis TaxID=1852386 RepID=UPI00094B77E6|nr:helix-turn-helix domain-containing protein [Thermophilibacter provencensis]
MGEKNAAAAGDITEARFQDTAYSYTLSLIQGKHKMAIPYCLMEYEPVRFNEMRRYLGGIADKTLSANLKELERDGLVARREYPQIPPRVEYSLTSLGDSLMVVLDGLCVWGAEHMPRR